MPQSQTVQVPHRVPFVVHPENRGGDVGKDARLINCYVEKESQDAYQLYGRPGTSVFVQVRGPGRGEGIFNWNGNIFVAIENNLYVFDSASPSVVTFLGAPDSSNGVYAFSINNTSAPPKLQLGNGVAAYNYDSTNGFVQITDVDFPSTFVKGWAFLDGSTYVMDKVNGIHGSDIEDPTSWNALNKILAQIEPDTAVALAKQLVYVVALKGWTTELFYDAGNATGSPLGAVQGAKINYGCISADSVQEIDGALYWLSYTKAAAVQVMKLDALKPELLSTKPIERLLEKINFSSATIFSLQVKLGGHSFYIVTFKEANLTLVYDIREAMWSQWTDTNGNYFPFVSSTYARAGVVLLQHETDGKIYQMSDTLVNDNGSSIPCEVYTPIFDGGTKRRKVLSLMDFVADQVPGSELEVQVSDDDYQTWSPYRTVDLSLEKPTLNNCGTFLRRAWHMRHVKNTKLRLKAVELSIDMGTL